MKQVIHRIINRAGAAAAVATTNELQQRDFWDAPTVAAAVAIEREVERIRAAVAAAQPGCPLVHGYSAYSQCDEDGIIEHILSVIARRTALDRTCVEIAAGVGLENNTHLLMLQGFKGFWVEGNPDRVAYMAQHLGGLEFENRLVVRERMVSLRTLPELLKDIRSFPGEAIDVLSTDIDGNDLYILTEMLKSVRPKLIVAEYNPKFPPPLRVVIDYDENHAYATDDFYGASLMSFVDALQGYRLVSCNISGVNAFFVRDDLADLFPQYDPADLYQPFRRHLALVNAKNFRPTLKYLRQALARDTTR